MKVRCRFVLAFCFAASMSFAQNPVRPSLSAQAAVGQQSAMAQSPNGTPPTVGGSGSSAPGVLQNAGASAPEPARYNAAPSAVFWSIFAAISAVVLVGLSTAGVLLKSDKDWTFADAISESNGKPSSSRLIAFIGMLVIAAIVLGIGYSSLWVFLESGQMPSLSATSTFLVACAGLFTPYLVGRVSQAMANQPPAQSLAPVVIQTANSSLQNGQLMASSVSFGAPQRPPIT